MTERGREAVVAAWVAALVVLLLGPVLLPGFTLTYDMVWVPDLALTRDAIGAGSGLPRAVPSDAVVAVVDEVVPGVLLQKVVLVGALIAGGTGAARLLPSRLLLARLVAATVYVWSPLVVERLVLGHWPLLLALAVTPWLLAVARTWRAGPPPVALWWLVPLGSLAASSGLTTAVLLLAAAARRGRLRPLAVLLLVANLPWLVAGLLHAGTAATDPSAAGRFALSDEGPVPGPLAALTLGGVWNSEVVPAAREGALGWLAPLVLVPLAVVGVRVLRAELDRRTWWVLVGCWVLGWAGASLTWVAPSAGAALAAVPGGGVLRDGGRLLVLCAPLLALGVGRGAQALAAALPPATRVGAGLGLVALPLALLPGVAWGAGAGLRAVSYPADHAAARTVLRALDDEAGPRGDTVLLPFASYRAPSWNGGRKVLDPTGRYLGVDVVQDDVLSIDGEPLQGEDPRAAAVRRALDAPDPVERRDALARLGIGAAVTDLDAGDPPEVEGPLVLDGDTLVVQRLPGAAAPPRAPWWWWPPLVVAWAAYVGGLVVPLLQTLRRARRPRAPREV